MRVTGRYEQTVVAGETVRAFIPNPLPPHEPPLLLDERVTDQLLKAQLGLARLELAADLVPSIDWFVYAFVRKEAVLSSQIEGTQATLIDLLTFEAEGSPESAAEADVGDVCNYLDAVTYARAQMQDKGGLPLSMRLLNEAHRLLTQGARGSAKLPGEIRRSQNWIGGTRPGNARFVPPPPQILGELLSDFENYIHAEDELPLLIRAGLLHAQFETIHPYLDGNGRIGRLLVALLLEHWKLLSQPLLYLSLFIKRNREEYYRLLNAVRTEGDWEAWIVYFLDGVATIADEAVDTARELFAMVGADRTRVLSAKPSTVMALRLFEQLPHNPIVTVARARELLGTTKPTATNAIIALVNAGVLVESSGRKRNRSFHYAAYLDRLRAGTELAVE